MGGLLKEDFFFQNLDFSHFFFCKGKDNNYNKTKKTPKTKNNKDNGLYSIVWLYCYTCSTGKPEFMNL